MMVGSWACKVSSEIHIGGRRVSEPVHDNKGKEKVMELGDEKDAKRTRVVMSKGCEVVGLGYLRLSGVAAEVMHKGENSGNPNRVNQVSKMEQHYPSWVNRTDRISQIDRDSRSDQ
jgi:predicted RNA-binding protein with PUA domain